MLHYQEVYDYFKQLGHELLETEYIGIKVKMKYKCICGNIAYSTLNNMKNSKNGHTCKKCASERGAEKNRLTYQEVYDYFESKQCHLLESTYINNQTLMKYICECGNESYITFGSFKQGHRCNKHAIEARKEKQKFDFDYVYNYFKSYKNYELLETNYVNDSTKMKYKCDKGHIRFTTFNNFRQGNHCRICADENNRGDNNGNWNPNLTEEQREQNNSRQSNPNVRQWRKQIFKRDCFTCQICGSNKSNTLCAHHINSWDWCIDQRFNLDNGVTLCQDCHCDFHNTYGYGNNNKKQFEEFKKD
jgi:hypothetical protein